MLNLCEKVPIENFPILVGNVVGVNVQDVDRPSPGPVRHGPYAAMGGRLTALGNEDMPWDGWLSRRCAKGGDRFAGQPASMRRAIPKQNMP